MAIAARGVAMVANPAPARRACQRRQPRRTRGRRAAQDGEMAAGIFVVARTVALQMVAPQRRRRSATGAARSSPAPCAGMPISATVQHAAAPQALERIVAGLGTEECHRALGERRAAHDLAAVAMQAARHVDRDDA